MLFDVAQAKERRLRIDVPECYCDRAYLVESTNGDLLYVQKFVKSDGCSDPKYIFMFQVTKSYIYSYMHSIVVIYRVLYIYRLA